MTHEESDSARRAAVLAADDLRRSATASHDADALERLLLPEFTYTHIIGARETGASYVARLRAGTGARYRVFERHSANVRLYGDVALMEGEASLHYESPPGSEPKTAHHLYLAVWVCDHGQWRMASYASTPKNV